jgi:hypothetical protein
MEKTKFTIGSWFVDGFNPPRIYANDGVDIIAQCDSMGEKSNAEELANARLIAAAPELLAALQEWKEYADANGYSCDQKNPAYCSFLANTINAIAKATE